MARGHANPVRSFQRDVRSELWNGGRGWLTNGLPAKIPVTLEHI